jgi:hypothetical protein
MKRISSAEIFAEYARQNFMDFSDWDEKRTILAESLPKSSTEEEYFHIQGDMRNADFEIEKYGTIAIIFSSMAVEAYIYDYAARNLSGSFTQTHIEKMDVVSKWVVVPQLVTGKKFPKDKTAFALLKKLIEIRNSLVHAKSVAIPVDPEKATEFWIKRRKDQQEFLKTARQAVATLDALADELERLDPNDSISVTFRSPVGKFKANI